MNAQAKPASSTGLVGALIIGDNLFDRR